MRLWLQLLLLRVLYTSRLFHNVMSLYYDQNLHTASTFQLLIPSWLSRSYHTHCMWQDMGTSVVYLTIPFLLYLSFVYMQTARLHKLNHETIEWLAWQIQFSTFTFLETSPCVSYRVIYEPALNKHCIWQMFKFRDTTEHVYKPNKKSLVKLTRIKNIYAVKQKSVFKNCK